MSKKIFYPRKISDEDLLDLYDRLATKWAVKAEARMRKNKRFYL